MRPSGKLCSLPATKNTLRPLFDSLLTQRLITGVCCSLQISLIFKDSPDCSFRFPGNFLSEVFSLKTRIWQTMGEFKELKGYLKVLKYFTSGAFISPCL